MEFLRAPGRDEDGRVTLVEDDRDVIVEVSRPYNLASWIRQQLIVLGSLFWLAVYQALGSDNE